MNLGFEIGFDRPWFLLLLLILPLMWYFSYNSLAGLGKSRRILALLLRSLVVLLLVSALAHCKWQQKTDRLTVIYVLDQSESIPSEKRDSMLNYVHEEVLNNRRKDKADKAGVIVFGGNAKIESAPFDGDLPLIGKIESNVDLMTSSTSLESALKLAKASFPEDTARRVVIISDGNENVGDALAIAEPMADDGIGFDAFPIELLAEAEVSVDKVVLPTDIRKGQEFETKVVITNHSEGGPDGGAGQPVTGKLRFVRKTASSEELIDEREVTLEPGKNIRGFKSKLDRSAVYTTEAVFVPNDKSKDMIAQNNRASAFTHVRGKGKVLLIEDAYYEGEFVHLIQRLQANSIEVETMSSAELYTTAGELLQYDSVILGNLPRASSDENGASDIQSFSDAQIKMLVDNCEHMGCGIVMLGGDRSFGAGGWSNSLLEKAMPVDFQIKNDKISAVGALAMMMHACEMPNGNYWQIKIAEEAIKVLGPMDYCGVVEDFGANPRWMWRMPNGVDRVFQNRNRMMGMVNRMTPTDMQDFAPSLKLMLNGLKRTKASMKHIIIISDGDPNKPSDALLRQFKANKITVSTVAVGTHGPAGSKTLKHIATMTGGRYREAKSPKALPSIYQREARRVAKPVIKESKTGMNVVEVTGGSGHEIMSGIEVGSLPPFLGYVLTTIKKSSLVEQLAIASEPKNDNGENSTLLATWRYGNGRTVAFTSDAGYKWTSQWFNDAQYDKLFVQMIRHSMRPITESANFTVAAETKDGVSRITITALDEDENFLNGLEVAGRGINSSRTGQGDNGISLQFSQVGPGRYVAEHAIEGSGNLLYTIFPGEGYERLTAGVNVPYSSEYSQRQSNTALLDSLTRLKPRGGKPGYLIEDDLQRRTMLMRYPQQGSDESDEQYETRKADLLAANAFRPTLTAAVGIRNIWPLLLVICGVAFLSDVFIRRVAISFDWFFEGIQKVRQRFTGTADEQKQSNISRLKSRKMEIEQEIETRRAATKFEPSPDIKVSGKKKLEEVLASEIEKTPALPPKIQRDKLADQEKTSYTSRLLDAKRKVQKERDRGKDPES